MYQMLIVDDEKEIREGLFAWPWEELNVQALGRCAHGLEALQFLSSTPVDIVMSDIRMPFMDGIELMEVLKRQYPFIHVIILSGYSDFEYARKAIQLGAVDYLLKPIVFEDMVHCVKKLTARLEEKKQAEQRMAYLELKNQQLSRVLREKFLNDLFHGPLATSDLEQYGAEGEVLLEETTHTAAVLRMDRLKTKEMSLSKHERELIPFSLDNILSDFWDAPGQRYHLVNRQNADTYLLSKGLPDQDMYKKLMVHLLRYKGLFKSTFSIVSGPPVAGPEFIYKSVEAALSQMTDNVSNTILISEQTIISLDKDLVQTASLIDDPRIESSDSTEDGLVLTKAKQYIKKNYNRSLTLGEVAEQVYLSPGHLSTLFKKSGTTFLKYLTDIRMNQARKMMFELQYNIYEIAEKVGYSDPAYFSELFKKHTGMSPNEYRKQLKAPSDL